MKTLLDKILLLTFVGIAFDAYAQSKSLSSTLEVYVFPKSGQVAAQQSQHEAACYEWAVTNTGSDPFDLARQQTANQQQAQAEMEQVQSTGKGAGVRGAAGGAVAGAVVGEIVSDDAGKGAAYGAAVGGIAKRRQAKKERKAATKQAESSAATTQQTTAKDLENFRKAFSVCLEAKDYMVKY